VRKANNLNFLELSGHLGPVMGLIYLYTWDTVRGADKQCLQVSDITKHDRNYGDSTLWFLALIPSRMVPSDFHLFRHIKKRLSRHHYASDYEVKTAVKLWCRHQDEPLYGD